MSHTATVKMEFRNKEMLKETCERLGWTFREGTHQVSLYQGHVTCDFSVQLPGWKYPIAIQNSGNIKFDNYNGQWGKAIELEKLQSQYSRDVVIQRAMAEGYSFEEDVDEHGAIVLTLTDYS